MINSLIIAWDNTFLLSIDNILEDKKQRAVEWNCFDKFKNYLHWIMRKNWKKIEKCMRKILSLKNKFDRQCGHNFSYYSMTKVALSFQLTKEKSVFQIFIVHI